MRTRNDSHRARWGGRQVQARATQGIARLRASAIPLAQAGIAAAISYWIGLHLLGHPYPFFAPIAAWMSLGPTRERSWRRVLEVGAGVGLGVGLGEVIVHLIGAGPVQVACVLVLAVAVARFFSHAELLANQAGVQAIVIVGLPSSVLAGGAIGRWTDALVGAAVALLITIVTPDDPRRRVRQAASDALTALAETFEAVIASLDAPPSDTAGRSHGLWRGRQAQSSLEEWLATCASAHGSTQALTRRRSYGAQIEASGVQAVLVDQAMRSVRVVARRVADQPVENTGRISELLTLCAQGTRLLAAAAIAGREPVEAAARLREAAAIADPGVAGEGDWHQQSLILTMRSPIVDLLEAAGLSREESQAALCRLGSSQD